MKTIRVQKKKFRFEEFASRILEMLRAFSEKLINNFEKHRQSGTHLSAFEESILSDLKARHSSNFLVSIDDDDCIDVYHNRSYQSPTEILKQLDSGPIFFPFTVYNGGMFECADHVAREESSIRDKGDEGFIVKKKKRTFVIDSAIATGEQAVISDCGEYDQAMEDFIKSFIVS